MTTINHALTLEAETCCNCSIVFAIPAELHARLKRDGGNFYCPNGHSQHYTETQVQRLQRELTAARCAELRLQTQVEKADRENANLRTGFENLQQRIANGVCPCCHRAFVNLKRHIKTKHPKYDPKTIQIHPPDRARIKRRRGDRRKAAAP